VPPDRATYRAVSRVPLPRPRSFNEEDVSDKPQAIQDLSRLDSDTIGRIRHTWRCGLAAVSSLDDGVGRVIAKLRQERELRRTIVLYLSDNGYFFGEHRRPAGKGDIYEPALNVPFAARVPAAYRNGGLASRVRAVVSNQDVAATLLSYATAYLGPILTCANPGDCRRMDGRSLKPLLGGRGHWRSRRGVLVEIDTGQKSYTAVRTHRYTYSELATGERELYDLKRDPYELLNRAGHRRYARVQAHLAARLAKLRDCSGIKGRDPPSSAPFCQ
jgi:arylsulfatase A-like enzyme